MRERGGGDKTRENNSSILYLLFCQAFNVLSAIIEQRSQPGVTVECKVIEVRDVDVSCQSGYIS